MASELGLLALLASCALAQSTITSLFFLEDANYYLALAAVHLGTHDATATTYSIQVTCWNPVNCGPSVTPFTLIEGPATYNLNVPLYSTTLLSEECKISGDVAACSGWHGSVVTYDTAGTRTETETWEKTITGLSTLWPGVELTTVDVPTTSTTSIHSTTSEPLPPGETALDIFWPGNDMGVDQFALASVVAQGPATTQFEMTCTGYMSAFCDRETPISVVAGPSTFRVVIPDFSELYYSEECTMACGTATCTALMAVNPHTNGDPATFTYSDFASLYVPITVTGALPSPLMTVPTACAASTSSSTTTLPAQTAQAQASSTVSQSAQGTVGVEQGKNAKSAGVQRAVQQIGLVGMVALICGFVMA